MIPFRKEDCIPVFYALCSEDNVNVGLIPVTKARVEDQIAQGNDDDEDDFYDDNDWEDGWEEDEDDILDYSDDEDDDEYWDGLAPEAYVL